MYLKCRERISKRAEQVQSRYYDIFHRKLLINQSINPIANHVCMTFGPSEEFSRYMDRIRGETLWDKKIRGEEKKGRRLIARNRIEASHDMGGLEMASADTIYTGLGCNLLQSMKEEGKKESFYIEMLEKVLEGMLLPKISELQKYAGRKIWEQISIRI